MRRSLAELHEILRGPARLPEPDGFPIPAILAAIAYEESRGDPNAWVAHDPPSNRDADPSSGVYQVHKKYWPAEYEQTELVRRNPSLSDREKIVEMTHVARRIIVDALQTAAQAARILAQRGYRVTPLMSALFMNATWQAGSDDVLSWARRTRRADPRAIVHPERALAIEASLRELAGGALGSQESSGLLLGVLVVFGIGALVISQWDG